MPEEKTSYRDKVTKFIVKKGIWFRLEDIYLESGKYYDVSTQFYLVSSLHFGKKQLHISPDFGNLAAHFTI